MLVLNTDTNVNNINYIRFMEQQKQNNKNDNGNRKNFLEPVCTRKIANQ